MIDSKLNDILNSYDCNDSSYIISDYIKKKIEVLHFYESEMRAYPHSRSYEAVNQLASLRGFTVGAMYAEAFEVGRIIKS